MRLMPAVLFSLALVGCSEEEPKQSSPTDPTVDPTDGGDGADGTSADGTDGTSADGTDGTETGDTGTDTEAPTVTITDDSGGLIEGPVVFTFTFSEDVGTSFDESDITLSAGAAGEFATDGSVATLAVEPPADERGDLMIDIASGAFEDAAGNANADAVSATVPYDTVIETVIFDFETDGAFEGFGGVGGSSVTDPTDSSNTVGELVKAGDAQVWGGVTLHRCDGFSVAPMDTTGSAIFTVRVWTPEAGMIWLLKIEDKDNNTLFAEQFEQSSAAGTWETLTFDLGSNVDSSVTYNKLSLFPNFGRTGVEQGGDLTFYVDDVIHDDIVYDIACP